MHKSDECLGFVHSIDSFSAVDGPGNRFVVFMQGCQMRCMYCENRDTWDMDKGTPTTPSQIMKELQQYSHYLSGGGITVSGGEPTLQAQFVSQLFARCKQAGIHTCLDSNGFIKHHDNNIDSLLNHTDLVLLDIKSMNKNQHIALTSVSNHATLDFATHLSDIKKPVWIRHVVVPGLTDTIEGINTLGQFIRTLNNVEQVELLGYHELGKHKWKALGKDYPLVNVRPASLSMLKVMQTALSEYHPNVIYS